MTATRLVADVGGTNTRIGLAENGALLAGSTRRFRNDDHAGFSDTARAYLAETACKEVGEIVVAVAGPVANGAARLTNRDWHFTETGLSAAFGGVPTRLLNDLFALGHASPQLDPDSLDTLLPAGKPPPADGQSLIVGIGTGFNVSPVLRQGGQVHCLRVEYGHVCLQADIADALRARLGAAAGQFETVEHVFSGRGYTALSRLVAETDDGTGSRETDFAGFYAGLAALLCRGLMLAFLPVNGLYFAGGVARSLFATPARIAFADAFSRPFALDPGLTAPVYTILDDAAALTGCAVFPIGD